jgi:hypothetical protein
MSISLESSIRSCKVNTGWANKVESDRFLNPTNMVCIPWNNMNNKGQNVCADSQWTKTPGCNSALDRVSVENFLRPQYSDYINLNTAGIGGDMYGDNANAWNRAGAASAWENSRNKITGNYGLQFRANTEQTCFAGAYERAMAEEAQQNRGAAYSNSAYNSSAKRSCGMGM